MSFCTPYGIGKKPTKHTDTIVRVLVANFKCANVLAAFLCRSEKRTTFHDRLGLSNSIQIAMIHRQRCARLHLRTDNEW